MTLVPKTDNIGAGLTEERETCIFQHLNTLLSDCGVMKSVNHKGIGLLLTVTFLIASSLSIGGRVICVGLDGQVAIESAGWRGVCAEVDGARQSPHAMNASTHCGTCLDYEISIDQASKVAGISLMPAVSVRVDSLSIFAHVPPRRLRVPAAILPPSQPAQYSVLII